jgi:hypothetical protein
MCGLTLSVHPYPMTSPHEELLESLCETCAARGPDVQSTYSTIIILDNGARIELRLSASVLGLRGDITQQPIIGKRGVLGWNGQVSWIWWSGARADWARFLMGLILEVEMIQPSWLRHWNQEWILWNCWRELRDRRSLPGPVGVS